ncbi:hypothetical protein [Endozoicomonas sp. SCSIO W0465]|uniref:hypothetical protein n=1 Tax=Endozoicomonas sp. SCSIO W0465 TaxID=2918516 RepID=UPI0020762E1C|nr:hypothetical protein [Endozoicomonas sp. SCSIO W0465]USE34411.1 hypothetical protein MJO57_19955 [Endozoicomonas sp. SCSIO W0465]
MVHQSGSWVYQLEELLKTMQQGAISNSLPRCSMGEASCSTENTQNPKASLLSTIFNCGYEFVRSINPHHGYHQQNDGDGIQFDFQPEVFAKSVIKTVSPSANLLISGLEFINNNRLLAVPMAMMTHIVGSAAHSVSRGPIEINDAATLQQIGKKEHLPLNGNYIQTSPIHVTGDEFQAIGSQEQPFLGTYYGNGTTISGLTDCLFDTVSCDGSVKKVVITHSHMNIGEREPNRHRGFIACAAKESAFFTSNQVANSVVTTDKKTWQYPPEQGLGLIVGQASGGVQMSGNQVNNCRIDASRKEQVGLIAGIAEGYSIVSGSNVSGSSVIVKYGGSRASAVVGKALGNVKIESSTLTDINLESSCTSHYDETCHNQNVGGVAGYASGNTEIRNTVARNVRIITRISYSDAGVIVGKAEENLKVFNSKVDGSSINSFGQNANVAIGVGAAKQKVQITNTHSANCTLSTGSSHSNSGGAAGKIEGRVEVSNTEADHLSISTHGVSSHIGFGAGYSSGDTIIKGANAADSHLISYGRNSDIGGGAGILRDNTRVSHTTLTNCHLLTQGLDSDAGGGAGNIAGNARVDNTTINFSNITTTASDSDAGFSVGQAAGNGFITNTRVNNSTVQSCEANGNAGGAGELTGNAVLQNTQVQDSTIIARGNSAYAAAGAGFAGSDSRVDGVVSKNNYIIGSGRSSHSAVGAGKLSDSAKVENIRAFCSHIEAKGKMASAAVGASVLEDTSQLSNILACGGSVRTLDDGHGNAKVAAASITGDPEIKNVTACHVKINDKLVNKHCEAASCVDACLPNATHNPVLQTSQPATFASKTSSHSALSSTSSKPTLSAQAAQTSPFSPVIGEDKTVKHSIPHGLAHKDMPSDFQVPQETQTLSMEGVIGLGILGGITIGGAVVYGAVNIARAMKNGETGWALAKAPFSYAASDLRSLCRSNGVAQDSFQGEVAESAINMVAIEQVLEGQEE